MINVCIQDAVRGEGALGFSTTPCTFVVPIRFCESVRVMA